MTESDLPTPRISSTVLDTKFGEFKFFCFAFGEHEDDNVIVELKEPLKNPVLVRIQSACYTSEIFRSTDCDCHEQLEASLERISREGGAFVYVLQDGRGAGLYKKVLGLELGRTKGLDTADAYKELGIPQDPRTYQRVGWVLKYLKISEIRLLTNNPRKLNGLADLGFKVQRQPLQIPPTEHSIDYLRTKKLKMGHLLDLEGE